MRYRLIVFCGLTAFFFAVLSAQGKPSGTKKPDSVTAFRMALKAELAAGKTRAATELFKDALSNA